MALEIKKDGSEIHRRVCISCRIKYQITITKRLRLEVGLPDFFKCPNCGQNN